MFIGNLTAAKAEEEHLADFVAQSRLAGVSFHGSTG
jgi:hypothetical protein